MNKTLLMALALCGCVDNFGAGGARQAADAGDAGATADGRAGFGGFGGAGGGAGGFGGFGGFDQAVDAAGGADAQLDQAVDGVVQADGQVDLALPRDQAVDAGGPQLDHAVPVDQAVDATGDVGPIPGGDRQASDWVARFVPECDSGSDCTPDEVCSPGNWLTPYCQLPCGPALLCPDSFNCCYPAAFVVEGGEGFEPYCVPSGHIGERRCDPNR